MSIFDNTTCLIRSGQLVSEEKDEAQDRNLWTSICDIIRVLSPRVDTPETCQQIEEALASESVVSGPGVDFEVILQTIFERLTETM